MLTSKRPDFQKLLHYRFRAGGVSEFLLLLGEFVDVEALGSDLDEELLDEELLDDSWVELSWLFEDVDDSSKLELEVEL